MAVRLPSRMTTSVSMPTVQGLDLPKPKNWQDFEIIVCDAMSQRWKSPNLQKNGRSGQKQKGIDIYGPGDIGRRVGIQCKRYKGPLKLETVAKEISAAETFKGVLSTLFIATTADHDAKLQQEVRLLSDKRVASGKFAVALLFWDDIVNALLLNPAVFQAHYPQVLLEAPDLLTGNASLRLWNWATTVRSFGNMSF
jgi:Restriction endonuclease